MCTFLKPLWWFWGAIRIDGVVDQRSLSFVETSVADRIQFKEQFTKLIRIAFGDTAQSDGSLDVIRRVRTRAHDGLETRDVVDDRIELTIAWRLPSEVRSPSRYHQRYVTRPGIALRRAVCSTCQRRENIRRKSLVYVPVYSIS